MKTSTITTPKTKGFSNGYAVNPIGRNAESILSKPCNRFQMPPKRPKRRAACTDATRAGANQARKAHASLIIRQRSFVGRVLFVAFAVLVASGVAPMALATLQLFLINEFGLIALAGCLAVDAALIYAVIKHA